MASVKVVLFDYDGVLRDTRELLFSSLEKAFIDLEQPVPSRQEMVPYMHHHKHIHGQFVEGVGLEKFEEVYFGHVYKGLSTVDLYTGAREALAELGGKYKLGIVSSANGAKQEIEAQGLGKFFDCIVGGLDTTEHKPHRAPVDRALELLGESPEHAVMIGDLPTDIHAAKAAGLQAVIGITTGLGQEDELQKAGADHVIAELNQLPELLKEIEQK